MSDVSRETPSWPAGAERVFPLDRLELIAAYASLLATQGVTRGLIGPREVPRLWERHLLNCAVLQELVPEGSSVCDVGSGAGLPGLVLAIARPDLSITLLEPLLRRTTFLDDVVQALGLRHVSVVRGRADALHGRERFDVVTSRAVAPLDRLLEWSMPLVSPDGALVAMKGSSVATEIEDSRSVWSGLGCAEPEIVVVGDPELGTATLVRVAWRNPSQVSSSSATYSRSPGGDSRDRRSHRRNRS